MGAVADKDKPEHLVEALDTVLWELEGGQDEGESNG